ncbi:uncharacterized protein TNCV_4051551 [Trichonephila clavipes]|nr:uncharacterized protein TNCV_4051551 [Trichonephila clavipes]
MLGVIVGAASFIAAIDPSPFPVSSWWYFVAAGLFLTISGSLSLVLIQMVPDYPSKFFVAGPSINDTTCNSTNLLNETVVYSDSPIVELRDVHLSINESAFAGSQSTPNSAHELVVGISCVQAPVLLKTRLVEELMHVNSVEAQSPPIGMMGQLGEGVPAQVLHPHHLTYVQNY